jgi:deoxyadenosine/deoxycytidine kinase
MKENVLVGVVGPCAAGKSTLIAGLKERGYQVKHIAQEHSFVPDMWLRVTRPDLLVYLDVSFPVSNQRRALDWTEKDYLEQLKRLSHARQHADLYIHTDRLSIPEVLKRVATFLRSNAPASDGSL